MKPMIMPFRNTAGHRLAKDANSPGYDFPFCAFFFFLFLVAFAFLGAADNSFAVESGKEDGADKTTINIDDGDGSDKESGDVSDSSNPNGDETDGLIVINETSAIQLVEEIEKNLVQDDYDPDLTDDSGINPDSIDLTGRDLSKLPCLSVGAAARGRLINGITLKSFAGLHARNHNYNWGTPELIAGLHYGVAKVRQKYPHTADLVAGDVSRKTGGRLKRHKSHQSGRDIDVGYYFKGNVQQQYFVDATTKNIDAEKTWTFIEALLDSNKIQYIFLEYGLQRPLYNYVKYKKKAPKQYLDRVFQYPRGRQTRLGIIRHARGHRNHMHIRFWSPIAVTAARKNHFRNAQLDRLKYLGPTLPEDLRFASLKEVEKYDWGPAPKYQTIQQWKKVRLSYRVRKGDTLGGIARKVGVKTRNLMRQNKMSGRSIIRPGQRLRYYKKKLVNVEVEVFPADDSKIEIAKKDENEPKKVVTAPTTATEADAVSDAQPQYKVIWKPKWTKVKPGDNLWNIARRNKTTVARLCKLNGISSKTVLKPGQKLKVKVLKKKIPIALPPPPEPVIAAPAPTAPPENGDEESAKSAWIEKDSSPAPQAPNPTFVYRVTKGDCVYNISRRFNLKVSDICSLNNISAGIKLKAGQTLVLGMSELPAKASEANKIEMGKPEESAKLGRGVSEL
jgi:LysM repeat protein/murein endopeptidase